jgi:hypothetical protein
VNWTAILAAAGIPEPPGRVEVVAKLAAEREARLLNPPPPPAAKKTKARKLGPAQQAAADAAKAAKAQTGSSRRKR